MKYFKQKVGDSVTLSQLNRILIIIIAVTFRLVSLFYSSAILNYFLLLVLVALTFYNILTRKIEINQFRKIFILLLLSALIFFIYNEDSLFIYFIASLAFIDESDEKLIKYFTITAIVSFISIIIAGQLGLINVVVATRYLDNSIVIRNSLGFGHVNTVSVYYLGIMFGIYYLFHQNKKKLILIYILTTIIAIYLYLETNCRTGLYIYIAFIIISLLYNKKLNKKLKKITPYNFIIFTILSFILAILFGKTLNNPINILLSSRPYFSLYYIKKGAFINLFGQDVISGYVLDNHYLSLLVRTGIIGFITYMYIIIKGSILLKKDYATMLIILFYLIYGIFEANLYGNFIIIILLKKIISSDGGEVNERKD